MEVVDFPAALAGFLGQLLAHSEIPIACLECHAPIAKGDILNTAIDARGEVVEQVVIQLRCNACAVARAADHADFVVHDGNEAVDALRKMIG